MIACVACATELPQDAKFCFECAAPVSAARRTAEYKQVTVLFADVVHSMDLAAAVGAERLREIMAQLFDRCATVVQRYAGTVDKFTGDGIMAVFGAPVALEDHAFRACLAALELQRSDEHALQLRVGLNSGEVVAGEIGSGPGSYTAIGEQVGLAQRMESVAPPGGVMLSASTARLVEDVTALGEPELVRIKGAGEPVVARRLLGSGRERWAGRQDPVLVGRSWELAALAGMLDQAIEGSGCVVGVVGPPGIGKSRLTREITAQAQQRGVEVFATYCEAHASEIPFHAVTPLLRTALGIDLLGDEAARARVRERAPNADPEDLLLLDDQLGIADSSVESSAIDPDARRRRLTRLVNTVSLARTTPAVFVVEDVHWIDDVSESLLADFLAVIPQTPSLVVITYRPEYRGALTRAPNSQTIALAPLNGTQSARLATELIGVHSSVAVLSAQVAERAAGNPFFAEELVRDLAERGVLAGERGSYVCHDDHLDTVVPATVQATIAARVDRLESAAKQTLNAAAVIGLRFSAGQLAMLDDAPAMRALLGAELIDQVCFTPYAEYAFHHPLIRAVAYESQLKSNRAELHRRLATAIERRYPDALDENAALIAEHLEAAEDLRAAFDWHMRAGAWAQNRDIRAARVSWERAKAVANRLPTDDPGRAAMCIAPRAVLCGTAFRVSWAVADTDFDELRDLCTAAGDKLSLIIGMSGLVVLRTFQGPHHEAAFLATELVTLIESIGDPAANALLTGAIYAKAEAGEMSGVLSLSQRVIDWADGDPTKGGVVVASPLATAFAFRGLARYCGGRAGWAADLKLATTMSRSIDPIAFAITVFYRSAIVAYESQRADTAALQDSASALAIAEQSGDDLRVETARIAHGIMLSQQRGSDCAAGLALLKQVREAALQHRSFTIAIAIADIGIANVMRQSGDLDTAIALSRSGLDRSFDSGHMTWRGLATAVLVESLLQRGGPGDLAAAQTAVDRLAAVPTEPGFVLFEIPLLRLRALLARANGDEDGYREFADRYLKRATEVGYEGHIALAETMATRDAARPPPWPGADAPRP